MNGKWCIWVSVLPAPNPVYHILTTAETGGWPSI